MEVVFLKEHQINDIIYKKGDTIKVFNELALELIKNGVAKARPKLKKKES